MVMLTVAVLSSVSGYAYEPLVQEELSWNFIMIMDQYWPTQDVSEYPFTLHFGSPVEKFNNTYYPLMEDQTVYGFMRQDANRVYLLVDGEHISDISYTNENGDDFELSNGDEILIYDFGATSGDKYMTATVDPDVAYKRTGEPYVYPWMLDLTVAEVDTVIINGRKRRRMKVLGDDCIKRTFIEGVGVNIGFTHLPQYFIPNGGQSVTTVLFDSMKDAEGNVLFTKADFDAPAYRPLVQEGKAWSQISYKWFEDSGRYGKIWLPEMYFEGKCERNGKEYSVLRTSPDDVLALMRQEGGKVYLLIDEDFIGKYDIYDCTKPETDAPESYIGKEYLVYDFDAGKGDQYSGIAYDFTENAVFLGYDIHISDVDEISVNGTTLRRQHCGFEDMVIVEGYGSNFGQCLMPQVITCITGTGDYCTQRCEMHHIIDRTTREEIFTYEDFSKPSVGVEEIPAEQPSDGVQAKPKDNKMYDLNGREIRNPLPGTVYILNGEKHVAK